MFAHTEHCTLETVVLFGQEPQSVVVTQSGPEPRTVAQHDSLHLRTYPVANGGIQMVTNGNSIRLLNVVLRDLIS